MESSNETHLRSISLPCRLNSFFTQINIHLKKLESLVPFYSSTTIQSGLECLADLYFCVDELNGSSKIQQVHFQYKNRVLVEDALVGSTSMLDSCSKLIDLLTLLKENVCTLKSALRRRAINVEAHILEYISYRKKAKKNISEFLGSLDRLEREIESFNVVGEDHHLSMVIRVLTKIVTANILVFRALLLWLEGKTRPTYRFSLIAKLMSKGDESRQIISDVDMIDVSLRSLQKKLISYESKTIDVQLVMERLFTFYNQTECYEVRLNSLFRRLIQTRVLLLNILAN